MHRRTGDATTTVMIGLQGLQGKPVTERCTAHQRSPSLYDPWRDHGLAHATTACEGQQQSQQEARFAREHANLNTLGGELTLEVKNSAEVLG
jgi:hypothetical protein